MKQLKKTILTLALLIAATTQAWAGDPKQIGLNVEYEVDDVITSTTDVYVFCTNHEYSQAIVLSSSQSATIKEIQPTGISFDELFNLYFLSDGSQRELHLAGGIEFVSPVGQGDPLPTKVYVASGNGTWQDPYVFAPGPAASGTPVPLTWDAATPNTATLTNGMPAGNVTVSVEYFPQAELATSTGESPVPLAPAAIASVPANTDDPIVKAGTVANIGTSEVKQGTLKYFVKQADGNTAPTAPDYDDDGWTDKVPTADGLAQGKAYVWYYIEGAEPASIADRTDDNTRSDSDIMPLGTDGFVTLAAEPTYTVSLNKTDLAEGEPALWSAKSTNVTTAVNLGEADLEGVKKSETVTVTYGGTKKIIGVKAEKKASTPSLTLTSPAVGQVIGSDGKNYAYGSLPTGVTAVAKICYVSGSNGLALALTDEGEMNWSTAYETCAAHTPAFTGGTWKLASKDEWNNMITAAGSYTDLRDGFSSVGGTNMQSDDYWSSTDDEDDSDNAWMVKFEDGGWLVEPKGDDFPLVRACLAF